MYHRFALVFHKIPDRLLVCDFRLPPSEFRCILPGSRRQPKVMEETMKRILALATLTITVFALAAPVHAGDAKKKILYITATGGFQHDSREHSVPIIKKIGEESGLFEVTASDK